MWIIFCAMFAVALKTTTAHGDCFTSASANMEKCEIQGRYSANTLQECCQNVSSAGFTAQNGWVAFQNFFGKDEVQCTLCNQHLAHSQFRCFAAVLTSQLQKHTCHRTFANSTWPVSSKSECCTLHNSSAFSRDPHWAWSKERHNWYTRCTPCDKEGYVACYEGYQTLGHKCDRPQAQYSQSPSDCCFRPAAKAFSYVDHNNKPIACLPCPIDGGWTEWTSWSPCSSSCGQGLRRRARECKSPFPQHGGKQCAGSSGESQVCGTTPCHVAPEWGPWSPFSPCSVTCGTGDTERRRVCQGTRGQGCSGHDLETTTCRGPSCEPFQQGIIQNSEWTSWSDCDATCGQGVRTRKRTCPSGSFWNSVGTSCMDDSQTERCHQEECLDMKEPHNVQIGQIIAWTVAAIALVALSIILVVICKRKSIARRYYYQLLPVRFRKPDGPERTSTPLPTVSTSNTVHLELGCKTPINQKKQSEDQTKDQTDVYGYEIPTKTPHSTPKLRPPSDPYYNLQASWTSLPPDETHIYEELHPRSASFTSLAVTTVPDKHDRSAQTVS